MKKIIRIAIADDHKLIRSGISMILSEEPNFIVVQQAANGRELLDELTKAKPDVVLLDLEMPILGGRETLIEIHKMNPNIRVLMLTMHNNETFILQMMELGANGYLIKNTDPDELIKAINKVMESEFYFSDIVSMVMLQGISNSELKSSNPIKKFGLTSREIDVLRLICKEFTTIEIGEVLFLSPKTIEGYRKLLMEKTQSKNMAGLVLFAIKHKIYTEKLT